MTFKLSERSLNNLEGVDEKLKLVVLRAIQLTTVDFGVICGIRTEEEQAELFRKGASQCDGVKRRSKHQDGLAVDLMAYLGSRGSWEFALYDDIADAMKKAATELDVALCWGGAWSTKQHPYPLNVCSWTGTMEDAMKAYVKKKSDAGKRAFMDGPHFELIV
jgi:peptidoglycan L-alanyl-D-glutamate endopeptidase CwlK